jgi:hypothetical protein
MPQYMLLICNPAEGLSPEEGRAELPKWFAYTDALREAGALVADNALQPAATARTLRVRGGERIVTDGPFADTKEALAGYYVVDVPDMDAALDWAARVPSAWRGSVEVRGVMVFEGDGAGSAAGSGASATARPSAA